MRRTLASYTYLALLALAIVALNLAALPYDAAHPDQIGTVGYLAVACAVMNLLEVRIERGRLNLLAVVIGPAAILLNPLDATIVGAAFSVVPSRRGHWSVLANAVIYPAMAGSGSVLASLLAPAHDHDLIGRASVLALITVENWLLVALAFRLRTGESMISIVRHNFTPAFYAAFAYFGLAGLLISYVLDGSLLGYLLATIVCVLALALTDTIAGRRVRRVLESELSDADRHLFFSRAVEGVVHNLRNHMATAAGYLKEIEPRRLDPIDREALETAVSAADDAVTVLRSLSQGATPKVSYSPDPVDLNELLSRAIGMARPRARAKHIELALRESSEPATVRADPLLMREVFTNLINNAIDAAPHGGRVEATTGRRPNGWPYATVRDNGPGVPEAQRARLFEPHFTTKEGGTGLGLFQSFGVVREHQGELAYTGDARGAVFSVRLPPFSA